MLKTKLKISSIKIKEYHSNSKRVMSPTHQKGSILIGLIVTMVIMASLGAGMLYLTTTTTFQELFANNHARAYYAAESGGRHALATIRDAYANAIDSADFAARLVLVDGKTFTMTNGDTFQISALTTTVVGTVASVAFNTVGTVSSGFLQAKRQINYNIVPANQTWGTSSGAPTGPIDFSDYPPETALTGGGKVKVANDGLSVDLNTAAYGSGKVITVITNTAWTYTGDYAVQVKTKSDGGSGGGGGANTDWNMGLSLVMDTNGKALPYGYGITFFHAWPASISDLKFRTALPLVELEKPLVLLWQNVPCTGNCTPGTGTGTGGLNWIAYAPINDATILNGINGDNLGSVRLPTILVKVIRTSTYNDIRVYIGGPDNQGGTGGDSDPINFNIRKAYPKWTSIAAAVAAEMKWPSFNAGLWPPVNDYFTMINSDNTSLPTPPATSPIAKWVKNTDTTVVTGPFSIEPDTSATGSSIPNAVIRSTVFTNSSYRSTGIGLFTDPCGGNPKGDFYNLGIQAASTGGGGDGSGTIIQY